MQTVGRQRPLGVTIIAIILWVIGVLSLLGVILGFVGVAAFVHNGALDAAATVLLLIVAVIAIAEIILGWGLWTLKPWAFWATAIVEAIRVVSALYSWLVIHNSLGSVLFSLIVALVVLVYLFADPNVRAAFRT
jgi:hypothetical protein